MSALDDLLKRCDEVLALDEGAAPGPWAHGNVNPSNPFCVVHRVEGPRSWLGRDSGQAHRDDAALIASYRTAAPDLARALKAVLEALREEDMAHNGSAAVFRIRTAAAAKFKEPK